MTAAAATAFVGAAPSAALMLERDALAAELEAARQ